MANEFLSRVADNVRNVAKAATAPTGTAPVVPTGNQATVQLINDYLDHELANRVLDFYDGRELTAGLDSYVGMTPLAITSYDTYLEPILILNQVGIHTAEKTSFTPSTVSFDKDGKVNGTTATSVRLAPGAGFANIQLGYLFIVSGFDTQSGQSKFTFNTTPGWSGEYQLRDINNNGAFFLLNHEGDYNNNITAAEEPGEGRLDIAFDIKAGPLNDSFYASFKEPLQGDLTGTNAIITVYPLTLTDEAVTSLWEHLLSDQLAAFGNGLIRQFAQTVGISNI